MIDLVGPKGYTHNWVFHGTPGLSPEDRADELSRHLGHRTLPAGVAGHTAHLEAARLHRKASSLSSSPQTSEHHRMMAGHHAKVARQYATGQSANMKGLSHLPPDIAAALRKYDADVASGKISFGSGSNFAQDYPGKKKTDAALGQFIRSHAPPGPRTTQFSNPTSTAGRRAAYKAGNALPPSSAGSAPGYPITSASQWEKARQAVGRAGTPRRRAQLAKLLRKTAPQFGKTKALAQSWAAPGGSSTNMSNVYDLSQMKCPSCGYQGDDADFSVSGGAGGTSSPDAPDALRTPQPPGLQSAAGYSYGSSGMSVRGASSGNMGLANSRDRAIELARRMPITSASDIIVSRGDDGSAVIRHRLGGATVGRVRHLDDGSWSGEPEGGRAGESRTHQRAALTDVIGLWNRGIANPHRAALPAAHPPQQSSLMQQFGVPAIRLATPANDSDDGPRATTSDSGGSSEGGPGGLTPKGVAIYKKLLAKGLPATRALALARRAQSGPPGRG